MPKPSSASTIEDGAPRLDPARVRAAAQPIIWSNDDFRELGGGTPLETCLAEMKAAGYAGTELGHKFPDDPVRLRDVLANHGLALASGWHSTYLLSRPLADERESFRRHVAKLKACGSSVAILAECSGRTYDKPDAPLGRGSCGRLDAAALRKLAGGLDELTRLAEDEGLATAYHHHMGTVVESREAVDRLMESTSRLGLLLDTGHCVFAGADPLDTLLAWRPRVRHVHLKDVRAAVLRDAVDRRLSFRDAVVRGVFTVPGEGAVDYAPIFSELARTGYEGWLVVEAEQDPSVAPPLENARRARRFIHAATGV